MFRWKEEERRMVMLPHLANKVVEPDLRTMREVVKMASSIHPMIQLTGDCPSLNNDKRMPLLNTKVWVEEVKSSLGIIPHQGHSSQVSCRHPHLPESYQFSL